MRKGHLPTLTAVMFLAGLMLSSAPAGGWKEFAVFPTADDQELPDVHGSIIVWQQFVSEYGDYDIYVADVNDTADPWVFIIGDANDQMSPAVYENTVVWQDYIVWGGSADWDIRMADINDQSDPQIFVVTDILDNDEQNPAIHGNIVVWQDGVEGDFDIFGADITDPAYATEFLVVYSEHNQQRPAVHRTTVVL